MLSANMYEYVDVVSFNQHIGGLSDIKDATKMTWKKPYYNPLIVIESSIQNYNNRKSLLSDDGEKKSSRSSTKRSQVATILNRSLLYTESRDFLI